MTNEADNLEWLASQRAAGALSAEERRTLAAALEADPALRQAAAQYDRLHDLLRRFAATRIRVEPALAETVRERILAELEFQLSQQLDDALSDAASARLDRTVAASHSLQREESALRAADALIQRYAAATTPPDMSALAAQISAAVRREPVAQRRRDASQSAGRRMPRIIRTLAVAAAILLCVVTGLVLLPQREQRPPNTPAPPAPVVIFTLPATTPGGTIMFSLDESLEAVAQTTGDAETSGIISSCGRGTRDAHNRPGAFAILY